MSTVLPEKTDIVLLMGKTLIPEEYWPTLESVMKCAYLDGHSDGLKAGVEIMKDGNAK